MNDVVMEGCLGVWLAITSPCPVRTYRVDTFRFLRRHPIAIGSRACGNLNARRPIYCALGSPVKLRMTTVHIEAYKTTVAKIHQLCGVEGQIFLLYLIERVFD